jgi:hypothetical protein
LSCIRKRPAGLACRILGYMARFLPTAAIKVSALPANRTAARNKADE